MPSVALGFDPGFAAFGWAVLKLEPSPGALIASQPELLDFGVVRTEPLAKKLSIYMADDDWRRCEELVTALNAIHGVWKPSVICVESVAGSKGAKGAAQMGRAWGALCVLRTLIWQTPFARVSPCELKRIVTQAATGKGSSGASKEDVEKATTQLVHWTDKAKESESQFRKADREHAFDAIGAVLACRTSEIVRAAIA